MLKWKRIEENFVAVNVGKDYNGGPTTGQPSYYYKGLIIDTGLPPYSRRSGKI